MVASMLCSLCRPSILGGEPPHHYSQRYEHTVPGVLGGYECICPCALTSSDELPESGTMVPERDNE